VAAVCDICAKKPGFGNNRPWSRKITKRRFNPNIQRVRATVNGTPKRMHVCTGCLKAGKVSRERTALGGLLHVREPAQFAPGGTPSRRTLPRAGRRVGAVCPARWCSAARGQKCVQPVGPSYVAESTVTAGPSGPASVTEPITVQPSGTESSG
jgi:large subunit ribosomal protein L28